MAHQADFEEAVSDLVTLICAFINISKRLNADTTVRILGFDTFFNIKYKLHS